MAPQKAASIDPQDRASLPGPDGDTARQARLEGAYSIAMNVVRFLVDPGRADQSLQNVALSPGERQAYLKQFLQVRSALPADRQLVPSGPRACPHGSVAPAGCPADR